MLLILGVVFAIVLGIIKLIIKIAKATGKKKPVKAADKPVQAVALPNPPEKSAEEQKDEAGDRK